MELSLKAAWADFVFDLHQSGKWKTLTREERQYMDKTNREVKHGRMPVLKVKNLFNKYAPGTYTLEEIFFRKEV